MISQSTKQEFIKIDLKPAIPLALNIEAERSGGEAIHFSFTGVDDRQIKDIVNLFL